MEKSDKIINEIKALLAEAEQKCEQFAAGFDEGWANGYCEALENVLELLEKK